MSNMAVILGMQGKYLEAEELGERVLSLRTQYMGMSHPFRYVSKLYLAWLYNETRRFEKAEAIELEVLEFQRNFYQGDLHHDVLLTKSQLASTYSYMGRHHDAYLIKSEVLKIRLERTGEEHPTTLRCKSSLGMTQIELGKLPEAEALLADAYEMQRKILGDEHPETITTMSRTAKLYEHQGRRKEAEALYQDTLQASIRALGESHPRSEARVEDLNRIEHARRSSDTSALLRPVKLGVPSLEKGRGLSVDIQNLSMIDEGNENGERK